jgi:hypothetical protein
MARKGYVMLRDTWPKLDPTDVITRDWGVLFDKKPIHVVPGRGGGGSKAPLGSGPGN